MRRCEKTCTRIPLIHSGTLKCTSHLREYFLYILELQMYISTTPTATIVPDKHVPEYLLYTLELQMYISTTPTATIVSDKHVPEYLLYTLELQMYISTTPTATIVSDLKPQFGILYTSTCIHICSTTSTYKYVYPFAHTYISLLYTHKHTSTQPFQIGLFQISREPSTCYIHVQKMQIGVHTHWHI
jgi:hypothetical protein